MKIPLSAFEAHRCCDSESSRYALGGVLFEQDADGTPYAVATDGRQMVAMTWKDANPEPGMGPTIISKAVCEAIATAKKKFPIRKVEIKDDDIATMRTASNSRVSISVGYEVECGISTVPIEGRFPKWREIIPPEREGDRTIILDYRLLTSLLNAVAAHSRDSEATGVWITIPQDVESPVVMVAELDDRKAVGVLMPKVSDAVTPPKWNSPPGAAEQAVPVEKHEKPKAKRKSMAKA